MEACNYLIGIELLTHLLGNDTFMATYILPVFDEITLVSQQIL